VILADWHGQETSFPPAEQQRIQRAGADVAGGQVRAAAGRVGQHALEPAVASFLRGFEVVLILAGVILLFSAVVGVRGLRKLREYSPGR
jgi:hypothetical protein